LRGFLRVDKARMRKGIVQNVIATLAVLFPPLLIILTQYIIEANGPRSFPFSSEKRQRRKRCRENTKRASISRFHNIAASAERESGLTVYCREWFNCRLLDVIALPYNNYSLLLDLRL
jgi:hypothetical protein